MQTCTKCATQIIDAATFCHKCGEAVSTEATEKLKQAQKLRDIDGLDTHDDLETKPHKQDNVQILAPGTVFSKRYTIEDVIGSGGMGVVYRAKDTLVGQTIALKLIRPERIQGPAAMSRLISEGTTARGIRHPNVIAVYDVGKENDHAFISMEYIDGDSLRAWHRKQGGQKANIPFRVVARIMAEILDGLAAAHEVGIVHRDLKPENIILTAEPTESRAPLKIIDFGLALSKDPLPSTNNSSGVGSAYYMAPEQITNADSAGPEADSYALSVMFYELLIGTVPRGQRRPPSQRRSDVPKAIDALIEDGLDDYAAGRPEDAVDYRKKLVAAINTPIVGNTSKTKSNIFQIPDENSVSGQLRAELIAQWHAMSAPVRWTIITITVLVLLGALAEELSY